MFNLNMKHIVPIDDKDIEPFREETDTFVTYLFNECKACPSQYTLRMLHDAIENRMLSQGREGLGPISEKILQDMEKRYKENPAWDKNTLAIREAYADYQSFIDDTDAFTSQGIINKEKAPKCAAEPTQHKKYVSHELDFR